MCKVRKNVMVHPLDMPRLLERPMMGQTDFHIHFQGFPYGIFSRRPGAGGFLDFLLKAFDVVF